MLLFDDVRGQETALRYLKNNLSSERIANSYLFSGPKGVGRALAAKAFAATLICLNRTFDGDPCGTCPACARIGSLDHPDVNWITPEKNKSIKIGEIREAKDKLSLKPFEAPVSLCVIEDAHLMTVEASNALLKVLEEPPGKGLIILITDKKELLLPTVVSRCSEVRFRALPLAECRDIILKNSDIDPGKAEFLAYFSQGAPGVALEIVEEGLMERKEELLSFVGEVAGERFSSCMSWDSESKDVILEDLDLLILFFRDIAMASAGMNELVLDKDVMDQGVSDHYSGYSIDKLSNILERLIGLKRALLGNVNAKIAAQVLPASIK